MEKASVSSGPELLFAIFIQDVHVIGCQFSTHRVRSEQLANLRLLSPQWRGVEAGDAAAIGRYPIDSAPSLEQVVDERMRQAVFDAIGRKLVTVEAAQTVAGAEPEKTM